jgi:hypothetical protein
LAWIYVNGKYPENFIDHINHNKSDNRIDNLRNATREQNSFNTKKANFGKNKIKGIFFNKNNNKWRAVITTFGKTIHLGYFSNLELSELVMQEARIKYHGNFACN